MSIGGFGSGDDVQATIDEMNAAWRKYQPALAPVANFTAIPYSDSEREGTQLNMDGRELQKAVTNAATQARVSTPVLEKNLAQIITGLQSSSDSLATALRSVVLIGVGLAAALAGLVGYLSLARGKQAAAAAAARQQTEDILRTVREGLFLLDADLKIGEIHSDATGSLFQRESIAGVTFEDLLRDMVPGKTLATALDFVNLLWSDRVEEDLIEDINPLNEVEAHFQASNGFETAYLKFSFKRVSIGADVTHILVSVTDITESVKLRLELQQAQAASEAQLDLLMSILHVAPDQLHAFLNDSESSLRQANAILMEPAGSDEQFKDKIAQLFRAVHGVKSDAAGLGLPTIEAKAHGFEDELQQLRSRTELTGRDLLDLPIKLDDLLSHFGSIRSLVSRLTALRSAFEAPGHAPVAESRAVRPVPVPVAQIPTVPPISEPASEDVDNEQTQRLPGQDVIEQAAVTLRSASVRN